MSTKFLSLLILFSSSLLLLPLSTAQSSSPASVCIIGSGIAGSSLAHFLRLYSSNLPTNPRHTLTMFERHPVVGGRMATVTIADHIFEAGASILHPMNYHASNFTKSLNLKRKNPPSSESSISLGIWDGPRKKFLFKTISVETKLPFLQKIVSFANQLLMLLRYGFSLFRMENLVQITVNKFLKYYESLETRPIFETVDDMLKWAGLYNLTTRSLQEGLVHASLSPILVQELVTGLVEGYGLLKEGTGRWLLD